MTRRLTILWLSAFFVALAGAAGMAFAVNIDFESWSPGPLPPEETIDLAAQRAQVILRGTAISIEGLDLNSAVDNSSEPFSLVMTYRVAKVTLRVSEVLKGPPARTYVFQAKVDQLDRAAGSWLKDGGKGEALLFLVSSNNEPWAAVAGGSPFVVDPGGDRRGLWALPLAPPLAPNTGHDRFPPIDLFGVRHDKAESILAATRDAVRATVVSTEPVTLDVPYPDNPKFSLSTIAPIDARLEGPARLWLHERRRAESGLRVLAFFPSDRNAALIMPLLYDRTVSRGRHKWAPQTYDLRPRAYRILKSYGRNVPQPTTEEPTAYLPVHHSPAAASIAIALLLLLAVPLVRRRFFAAGAALSLGVFLLLLLALLTRSRTVHELVMSVGTDAYEFGSYPDGLHLKRRTEEWPERAPLSYGKCDVESSLAGWEPTEFKVVTHDRILGVSTRSGVALCHRRDWSYEFGQLIAPHWMALIVCGVLPTGWVVRRLTTGPRRRAARIAKGLCGECGYDVRVNAGGRCPECGTAVTQLTPQPA